jgi:hypothetical protein
MDQPDDQWTPPDPSEPLVLAQSIAMSGSLSQSERWQVIDLLHELAGYRRTDVSGG